MAEQSIEAYRPHAALPLHLGQGGAMPVLPFTLRETGRWVIAAVCPLRSKQPCQVAAREAFEEARLTEAVLGERPVGPYRSAQRLPGGDRILCEVR